MWSMLNHFPYSNFEISPKCKSKWEVHGQVNGQCPVTFQCHFFQLALICLYSVFALLFLSRWVLLGSQRMLKVTTGNLKCGTMEEKRFTSYRYSIFFLRIRKNMPWILLQGCFLVNTMVENNWFDLFKFLNYA